MVHPAVSFGFFPIDLQTMQQLFTMVLPGEPA
jgi:hypothetical protein